MLIDPFLSRRPVTLLGRLSQIAAQVHAAVLGRMADTGMTFALNQAIQARIVRLAARIGRLIAALQAGTLRMRRSPMPGLTRRKARAREPGAIVLPRRFAWLRTVVPGHLLPGGPLAELLGDPELAGLLAASPRLVRTMRPLCRMLGVSMPTRPGMATLPARRRAVPAGVAPAVAVRRVRTKAERGTPLVGWPLDAGRVGDGRWRRPDD